MANPDFMVVKRVRPRGIADLETIQNVPDREDLRFGVSRVKGFPAAASFDMNHERPKDIGLADAMVNISSLLVVSERLKAAIEEVPGLLFENEVLPVKIVNLKKRVEKAPYFIIHQINHPACLDEKKSQGSRLRIDPSIFQFMNAMVLDDKKIAPPKMLFRVKQFPSVPLIRRAAAEKLAAGKFTGLEFHEIAGFDFLMA
jgi:hypothetical protein